MPAPPLLELDRLTSLVSEVFEQQGLSDFLSPRQVDAFCIAMADKQIYTAVTVRAQWARTSGRSLQPTGLPVESNDAARAKDEELAALKRRLAELENGS
jgi:hypothetical protein